MKNQQKEKIVAAFTLLPNNIDKLPELVKTIKAQSLKPDTILFVIPRDYGEEISAEIHKVIKDNKMEVRLSTFDGIRWNRSIPAMSAFPDACIVTFDPNFEYNKNYIKSLYEAHTRLPQSPISGMSLRVNFNAQHFGVMALDKKEFYGDYEKVLQNHPELLERNSADTFLQFMAVRNKRPISYWNCGEVKPIDQTAIDELFVTSWATSMWNYLETIA